MQGTSITYQALKNKDIDIYPEYTGTISYEILKRKKALTSLELKRALKKQGIELGIALGFNNSYGLAIARNDIQGLDVYTTDGKIKSQNQLILQQTWEHAQLSTISLLYLIIAAKSLGLEYRQILKMVLIPFAMPNIISNDNLVLLF